MNVGNPRGVESEKPRRRSLVSGMRELRAVAPRNKNRERDSLDYDEGIHLGALGQGLRQGVESGRHTCTSGTVVRSGVVERLGNDGS
jgi:hypothetical protein